MEKGISPAIKALSVMFGLAVVAQGGTAAAASRSGAQAEQVKGELIVKFQSGPGILDSRAVVSRLEKVLGRGAVLSAQSFQTDGSFHTVRLAPNQSVSQAI